MSNKLREVRRQRGMTQLQLAMRTGIHPNEISKVERGILRPFPGWKKRFAEALGVPEKILFEGVDDENSGRTAW